MSIPDSPPRKFKRLRKTVCSSESSSSSSYEGDSLGGFIVGDDENVSLTSSTDGEEPVSVHENATEESDNVRFNYLKDDGSVEWRPLLIMALCDPSYKQFHKVIDDRLTLRIRSAVGTKAFNRMDAHVQKELELGTDELITFDGGDDTCVMCDQRINQGYLGPQCSAALIQLRQVRRLQLRVKNASENQTDVYVPELEYLNDVCECLCVKFTTQIATKKNTLSGSSFSSTNIGKGHARQTINFSYSEHYVSSRRDTIFLAEYIKIKEKCKKDLELSQIPMVGCGGALNKFRYGLTYGDLYKRMHRYQLLVEIGLIFLEYLPPYVLLVVVEHLSEFRDLPHHHQVEPLISIRDSIKDIVARRAS